MKAPENQKESRSGEYMDELSLELSAFIEKNTVYPDLKKEIEKMYCKEKEQKKC